MESYKTVQEICSAELVEKRSRFIATVAPCADEEQANAFIAQMKKKYWDARHNVYAYHLLSGDQKRFSDDGEPHSTAGPPVLEAIEHAGLVDVAVVVTRYFGGVLLGTGGLVRAYGQTAAMVLDQASVVTVQRALFLRMVCNYTDYELLSRLLVSYNCRMQDTDFAEKVTLTLAVPAVEYDLLLSKITEIFCGKLQVECTGEQFIGFS